MFIPISLNSGRSTVIHWVLCIRHQVHWYAVATKLENTLLKNILIEESRKN